MMQETRLVMLHQSQSIYGALAEQRGVLSSVQSAFSTGITGHHTFPLQVLRNVQDGEDFHIGCENSFKFSGT